jgi:hypothetical protein
MSCDNFQENLERCNCTYDPCERKGHCCQCIRYHQQLDQMPACFFSSEVERTYDRSISTFVRFCGK